MIFTTSKDSKVVRLWQYIKERKKAKVLREQFLVAKGLINTETDPPQRYIEIYYKHDADDKMLLKLEKILYLILMRGGILPPRMEQRIQNLVFGPQDFMRI